MFLYLICFICKASQHKTEGVCVRAHVVWRINHVLLAGFFHFVATIYLSYVQMGV